ncbi:hypothetical protein [Pandoraea communis]|uniref:hypothetical protein n=1 Tax=Pandoraea communis TaxID=2508297 RepID=UPI001240AEC1|nr:hypothetical protein [Pandoraea communis]
MTIRHSWNQEQKDALRDMWKRKASTKELTEHFGIKMSAICRRARCMKLGPRGGESPTDMVRKSLEKLKRATLRDIEKATGLSHNAVDRAIARLTENEEAQVVGTRKVSAGRGHTSTVDAREYSLVSDEDCISGGLRGDGAPRVNRIKHRAGSMPIPPRHEIMAAWFGGM